MPLWPGHIIKQGQVGFRTIQINVKFQPLMQAAANLPGGFYRLLVATIGTTHPHANFILLKQVIGGVVIIIKQVSLTFLLNGYILRR